MASKYLEKGHVVVVFSLKKQYLQVAVHVCTVGVHLTIHLVSLPRLPLMSVVDAIVRPTTHCRQTHIIHTAHVLNQFCNVFKRDKIKNFLWLSISFLLSRRSWVTNPKDGLFIYLFIYYARSAATYIYNECKH